MVPLCSAFPGRGLGVCLGRRCASDLDVSIHPRPEERFPLPSCLPRRPIRRVSSTASAPAADGGIAAFTPSGRMCGGSSASPRLLDAADVRAFLNHRRCCGLRVEGYGLRVLGCGFRVARFRLAPPLPGSPIPRFPVSPVPRLSGSPFRRIPLQFSMPIASLHCVPPARAFA